MAVEELEEREELRGPKVPAKVEKKLRRGREASQEDESLRRLCVKFWRGQQYWYLNDRGVLNRLSTALVSLSGGKPPHRERKAYNFIHSIVEGKVSAASQRVPGYEITPATNDPDDVAAARLSGQIAVYGYDKWRVRRASVKTITNALVQREGFAMPYFDPNVGPFIETPVMAEDGLPVVNDDGSMDLEVTGMGEIKILTLNRSEVSWEPGVDFEDSPWWAVTRAMVVDEIERIPGFYGGHVTPDATSADLPTERSPSENQALVTNYLERPCPEYPRGRCLWIVGSKVICPEEDYPGVNPDGTVSSEPIIHRLSYTVDPEGDDRGLVEHLVDLARTINDCWSKLLEWKNRCLMPQMLVPRGAQMARRDDTPGANIEYNVVAGVKPEWERPPTVPRELFEMLNMALEQMRAISADVDVQPEPDLAAKTANAAIEQARARWQSFLGDLAEWHSRLMRHCLTLVAVHYSERRQVEIRGQYDWATLSDFTGKDLRSQVNVRVLPGSIETKGRAQVMQEIQFIQQNWPNAITPDAAIAILHGGNADDLLKSPQYDFARAARMVRLFEQGMEAVEAQFPPVLRPMTVTDPATGTTVQTMQQVPGWMPRRQDNIAIYKQVVGDAMKTPHFEQLPPDKQELFNLFYSGLEFAEQERAIEQAQLQERMAARLGMANAAAPQGDIKQPTPPSGDQQSAPV